MRHSAMFTLSSAHTPLDERQKIETLISVAPRGDDGRLHIAHDDLVIEPHLYGFFVHCGIVACQAADISATLGDPHGGPWPGRVLATVR